MNKQYLINFIKENLNTLKQYRVKSLSIFGSVARDEVNDDSDVDILVEFEKEPTTFDMYMDLKFYLEDHLGRKVDLVEVKMLKSQLKEIVDREAILIASV